jgi:hypothetical protein
MNRNGSNTHRATTEILAACGLRHAADVPAVSLLPARRASSRGLLLTAFSAPAVESKTLSTMLVGSERTAMAMGGWVRSNAPLKRMRVAMRMASYGKAV